jgi:Tol biopolymer transport system component
LIVALLLSAGVQATGVVANANPSISSDGGVVAFDSVAADLVTGDTNGVRDIFVRDPKTGTTRRISKSTTGVQGNGDSYDPSVSADGWLVAFYSSAGNLVAGDTNGMRDIFVRDRRNGTTTRISKSTAGVQGNGSSYGPSVSENGRFVAFESDASNLVTGDTNGVRDVFVRDRQNGTTTRISKSTAGVQGNGNSHNPAVSSDGRFVVFESDATNFATSDTNTAADVFIWDRQTGTTTRVSRSTAGAQGNGGSYGPSVSADGRFVVFNSYATNLVTGDTNAAGDIFVRDRRNGTTTRVSKSTAGVQGNGDSSDSTIAAAGRYVAFTSSATNLVTGDTNGRADIFVRDRQLGETHLISQAGA